jgi:hypothetical protein
LQFILHILKDATILTEGVSSFKTFSTKPRLHLQYKDYGTKPLSPAVLQHRAAVGSQTANGGDGAEWEWHPRHRPRAASQPDDGDEHPQKKRVLSTT